MKVLIIISKPPAKAVRDRISDRLSNFKKPVVTLFLGEKPEYHEENFYHAYTLDEAARLAVGLVRGQDIAEGSVEVDSSSFFAAEEKKTIKAYYSGGTLAGEAAMLIKDALNLKVPPQKAEGFMLKTDGHIVVDLGDDVYTQGKPHPMIDPAKRIECMQEAIDDGSTGVILWISCWVTVPMRIWPGPSSLQLSAFATRPGRKGENYSLWPLYAGQEGISRVMTRPWKH